MWFIFWKLVFSESTNKLFWENRQNGIIKIKIPGSDNIKLNLVSKDNVNGLGPIDKMKSAINYLIFGGDIN